MTNRAAVSINHQEQESSYLISDPDKIMDYSAFSTSTDESFFAAPNSRDDMPSRAGNQSPHHFRQESWYVDMLGHGLTDQDILKLFEVGGGGAEDNQGVVERVLEASLNDGSCKIPQKSEEPVLEQQAIMAISEAQQRFKNLANSTCKHLPTTSVPAEPTTSTWRRSLLPQPQPFFLPPICSDSASKNKLTEAARQRLNDPPSKFSYGVPHHLVDQKVADNHPMLSDLNVGVMLPKQRPKQCTGTIHVRCRGCRRMQSVSYLTTLVRCPSCKTVSPASTTHI